MIPRKVKVPWPLEASVSALAITADRTLRSALVDGGEASAERGEESKGREEAEEVPFPLLEIDFEGLDDFFVVSEVDGLVIFFSPFLFPLAINYHLPN